MTSPLARFRDAIAAGDEDAFYSRVVSDLPIFTPESHAAAWNAYQGSVDAALAFKDAVLPAWGFFIDAIDIESGGYGVTIYKPNGPWKSNSAAHPQLSIALLLACLAALIEKETT